MPRQPRLDMPGALHHIMVRGINRTNIFIDEEDRTRFLQRLGENVIAAKCSVYAWVLMNNHVHILFKSGERGISSVMRKLLTWYALYFNRRHKRTGHLFENRYKSILCEEERYLLSLVRYIHLNPIRAGVVRSIEELGWYRWSGHGAVMGSFDCKWMDVGYVLERFGRRREEAKAAYRGFVEEGVEMGQSKELTGRGLIRSLGGWSQVLSMRRRSQREESDERILGSDDFVEKILREAELRDVRQLKLRRLGIKVEDIIEIECKKMGVSVKELRSGSRREKVSRVRALVAWYGVEELGLSAAEVARHLGVSTSSITRAIARLEKQENKTNSAM